MTNKYHRKRNYERKRCKYVNFRVTPEESKMLDKYVELSGLKKQEYLTSKILNNDVVVTGNPRVFKALKKNMDDILIELKRINKNSEINEEFLELIRYVEELCERLNE